MASQLGLLFQDQNFNVQYSGASTGGNANAIKAQKKGGGLGGRKPLGEISNSANIAPPSVQASKKHNSKNLASIKGVAHEESNRKSITKTSDQVQTRSRKALSDISNSIKPRLHEAPKNKQNVKSIIEEPSFPSSVAEEQFLHDHRKCIKAQTMQPMDMDEFLFTVGLDNVSSKQFESPWAFSKSGKMKPDNHPLHQVELEEIPEHLIEDECLWKQKHNSPPCKTPKSPSHSTLWKDLGNDCDNINFKLMETTPELSKRGFPFN